MWQPFVWRNAISGIVVAFSLGLAACSSGGGGSAPPPVGTLTVSVSNDDSVAPAAIENARITVIDGDTGEVIEVLTTAANGTASVTLPVGQVLLRVAAQGYQSSPAAADGFPLPYTIVGGQTTTASFPLTALPNAATLGWISGRVLHTDGSTGVANALVLAQGAEWYTTASAADGSYVLFNIAAGDVSVTALHAGYNFATLNPVTVIAEMATADQDIASNAASASLSGSVTFLAVTNSEVEVALLHPDTNRVVPGLRDFTSNRLYSISGIPDGTFDAIASLETDGYVLDPDAIAKFGVPQITVSGGVVTPNPLPFDVTGAVSFIAPVNLPTLPSDAITVSWNAYPSTKNYILELIDQNGDVIWGGYVPTAGTEYTVGTATTKTIDPTWPEPDLEVGKFYRVRVYASVDDTDAPFYTLISATEDLEGVFQVGPATP